MKRKNLLNVGTVCFLCLLGMGAAAYGTVNDSFLASIAGVAVFMAGLVMGGLVTKHTRDKEN